MLNNMSTVGLSLSEALLIFTVDCLKDADLRKDMPFGGLDDE